MAGVDFHTRVKLDQYNRWMWLAAQFEMSKHATLHAMIDFCCDKEILPLYMEFIVKYNRDMIEIPEAVKSQMEENKREFLILYGIDPDTGKSIIAPDQMPSRAQARPRTAEEIKALEDKMEK